MYLDTTTRDQFLALLPVSCRSLAANVFLAAVRMGKATPDAVCSYVRTSISLRLTNPPDPGTKDRLKLALETVRNNSEQARAMAHYALDYERLPAEQRAAIKQERRDFHAREWMSSQPATEAQLRYLAALGWKGEPPASRKAASDLIDELRCSAKKHMLGGHPRR